MDEVESGRRDGRQQEDWHSIRQAKDKEDLPLTQEGQLLAPLGFPDPPKQACSSRPRRSAPRRSQKASPQKAASSWLNANATSNPLARLTSPVAPSDYRKYQHKRRPRLAL